MAEAGCSGGPRGREVVLRLRAVAETQAVKVTGHVTHLFVSDACYGPRCASGISHEHSTRGLRGAWWISLQRHPSPAAESTHVYLHGCHRSLIMYRATSVYQL